jgi:hypothetical protein
MTTTALTITERAAVALGANAYEIALLDLVSESARIREIKNAAGYHEAHGARMRLKGTRVDITKTGKAAREDARSFSDAVIAEEKRLIAILAPEESRLQSLQDEWDAAREAERQAKLQAEQTRIDGHRAGIEAIRFHVVQASGACAEKVQNLIDQLGGIDVGDGVFEEFAPAAHKAKSETIAALREIHDAATCREAEAARLQAEREELARQRAEQEARDAAERIRIAAEQQAEAARLAAERAAFAQEQRIAREKQAELDRQAEAVRRDADARAAQERAAADRQAAADRAEVDALLQQARAAEAARMAAARAEVERITEAARQAETDRLAAERAAQEAEAARLRAIEDAERQRVAEARARTNALRGELDALLDTLSDDDLHEVLIFARGMAQREAA